MKIRLFALAMLLSVTSLFSVMVLSPTGAHAQSAASTAGTTGLNIPVSASNTAGSFLGNLNITSFANQNGQLVALGTLTGTVTNALTGVTTAVNQVVAVPVTALSNPPGSCTILDLTLGPINLNLLGLVVQTNTIHLTITAQQGPGNLLGNLLCTVANLLNGNASLTAVANILNNLLGSLHL